jgi:hypothetical protein
MGVVKQGDIVVYPMLQHTQESWQTHLSSQIAAKEQLAPKPASYGVYFKRQRGQQHLGTLTARKQLKIHEEKTQP